MKSRLWQSSLALLLMIAVLTIPFTSAVARAAPGLTRPAPSSTRATQVSTTTTVLSNLEDNASQWGIFQDHGSARGTVSNVASPSIGGDALAASLIGGQPYTGIHAYRNLTAIDNLTSVQLDLSFRFSNATPVQALEFTTSKWENNQRWEWALQWEHVGDGGPQQGAAPTWRLWTGSSWQDTGVTQQLSAGTWHTLHLTGDIYNGNVRYTSFQSDGVTTSLTQVFAPVSSPGNVLAVAVQLDGDNHEDAYKMYIDGVTLSVGTN